MSYLRSGAIQCDYCGQLSARGATYEFTHWGSSADASPPEPGHICAPCAKKQTPSEANNLHRACWIKPRLLSSP